jgi:hypothetical protein
MLNTGDGSLTSMPLKDHKSLRMQSLTILLYRCFADLRVCLCRLGVQGVLTIVWLMCKCKNLVIANRLILEYIPNI